MLYKGPVRVPNDAVAGPAKVRVQLSADSKYKSIPTDIEIKLIADDDLEDKLVLAK